MMRRDAGKVPRIQFMSTLGAGLLLAVAACSNVAPPRPAPADIEAIKAADLAYATAWMTSDSDRVMATLTSDAVIVPSGIPAIEGVAPIRAFWWPPDSPPTAVTRFNLDQREAGGDAELGFVRGTFVLEFTYDGRDFTGQGDYVSILRRSPDGSWRISHRLWTDHPPQVD